MQPGRLLYESLGNEHSTPVHMLLSHMLSDISPRVLDTSFLLSFRFSSVFYQATYDCPLAGKPPLATCVRMRERERVTWRACVRARECAHDRACMHSLTHSHPGPQSRHNPGR
jgi:hypothetical protein